MKNQIQKLKEKISQNKKELFIIILIFLLAFGIRAHLMKYELLFEFDGYWHSRMISYIIQTGTYPDKDPLAYYQLGGANTHVGSDFFWYLCAFLYKLFTLGAPYNKETWILIIKILPALFGGLIAVMAYFIGKETFDDKKAGILLGFFTAIMPAFIYRQMAGWLEDDSFGWLPGLIAIYFLIKAIKAKNLKSKEFITNAILAGIFTGIMGWSWSGFQTLPLIIFVFISLALIAIGINKVFFGENEGINKAVKIVLASVIMIGLMAIIVYPQTEFNWIKPSIGAIAKILPSGGGLTGGETGVIGQSVGEESIGLNYFGNKYNFLIILLPFGIITLILSSVKFKKNYLALLLLSILIVTLVMAVSKLKFTYYFGFGMAIAASTGIYGIIVLVQKLEKNTRIITGSFIGFILFTGIAAGTFFVSQNHPNIEQDTGWKQALYWINTNTPKDSKFFNWWDEGHWITFIGERKATLDNRNYGDSSPVAKFIITHDENEGLSILADPVWHPDYLIFGDDLIQKESSLWTYALKTTQINDEAKKYINAGAVILKCSKNQTAVTDTVTYNCNGNLLTQEQWDSLPTTWTDKPNQVSDRFVLFVYKSIDSEGNLKIYALTPQANNSMLAKIWFEKPDIKEKISKIYFFKDVKVFKVN